MQNHSSRTESGHDEVSRLAYISWEKDGRPHGHELEYWLQAEIQFKATWPLLVSEHIGVNGKDGKPAAAPKKTARPKVKRKI